jgi:hypothetical protein
MPLTARNTCPTFRELLLSEMAACNADVLMAALALAAEDDALSTKSTVALPIESYSKRLDSLVTQMNFDITENAPHLPDAGATLTYLSSFLLGKMGYRVTEKPLELYSPYRIYMHRVLAQRCGTPEAIAIVLCSLLQRAAKAGVLQNVEVEVGIPAPGNAPLLRPIGSSDHCDADVKCVVTISTAHSPRAHQYLCTLQQLRKAAHARSLHKSVLKTRSQTTCRLTLCIELCGNGGAMETYGTCHCLAHSVSG